MTALIRPADVGLVFPDQRDVIADDARRFRRLSAVNRWREIFALPAVLDALGGLGFEFDQREVIADFTRHHMAALWRDGERVDWLKPLLPVYRHVLERSQTEPGPAGPIRVATAEGLILLKLLAFRLQDQTDVEALGAANRNVFDIDWIKAEWQSVFEPDDPRTQWFLGLLTVDRR